MAGILWLTPLTPLEVSARYPNTQGQHVTLAYGGNRSDYEHLIGLPATIGLLTECWNDENQAVSVVLPNWLPCQNLHPHITISWVDGSAPVKSNVMLDNEHESQDLETDSLLCIVEFLEWKAPLEIRSWRDREPQPCKQEGCDKTTRSVTGYCRSHRPSTKYRG